MWQQLFDASPQGLITVDFRGKILRVNRQTERIFGFESQELVGSSIKSLLPLNLGDSHRMQREKARGPWAGLWAFENRELKGKRKDGAEFPVEVSLTPLLATDDSVIVAEVRDITARKKTEEDLRQNEARFRNLFAQGPMGAALIGRDTKMLMVNAVFCQNMEYSDAELTTMRLADLTHHDDRAALSESMERLFDFDAPSVKIDQRYVRKDGKIKWASLTASVIRDGGGVGEHAVALMEDITERRRSEQKLAEQAALLDLADDAIIVRDLDAKITFWSQGAADTYKWTKQKALGRVVHELLKTKYPIPLGEIEAEVFNHGSWEGELEHTTRDGNRLVLTSHWSLRRDEDGDPSAVLEVNRNITHRRYLETQIEADKMQLVAAARLSALGMMAGGVAHEINNPLSIILELTNNLIDTVSEKGTAPPDMVVRTSEVVRDTADRIARIIRGLRQISREGSRDRLHPLRIDKVVKVALVTCRARFRDNGVQLIVPQAPTDLKIYGREVQIEQILFNLLQNAFDAVVDQPGEKWVRLEVGSSHDSVVISVTDSGPGVFERDRPYIMEPFFTTKPVGKGIGLGLSLSKTIAEEHGGTLEYSKNNGHARFSLTLPRLGTDRLDETAQRAA